MRSFIAIEIPVEIKEYLSELQTEIKKCGCKVSWVKPEDIHLTLKFLGEITPDQASKVCGIIESIALENCSFRISLDKLGAFPDINRARVIWVGINQGAKETVKIATVLEEKIKLIGIPKEDRPFHPHLTIARVKPILDYKKLSARILELKDSVNTGLEFTAQKITFFKSRLTPQGAIHEALKEANLKTS